MVHVVIGLRMEIVKYMQSHFFSFSTSCVTSFCSRMRFTSSSIVLRVLMIQWAQFTCPLLKRLLPLAPALSSRRKDCVELASQHKIDHHCGDGRGCVALGWEKKMLWKKRHFYGPCELCAFACPHTYTYQTHIYTATYPLNILVALLWVRKKKADEMKEKAWLWSLRMLCICMSSHIYIAHAHLYCNISIEHLVIALDIMTLTWCFFF